jgi:hypothetical protein
MTKNPPINWDDLVQFGVPQTAVIVCDGDRVNVSPPPSRFVRKFLSAASASPPPDGDRMSYLRHVRDLLMNITDWTQAADSPLTETQRAAWAAYRQALRDLPQAYGGEGAIEWPVAP